MVPCVRVVRVMRMGKTKPRRGQQYAGERLVGLANQFREIRLHALIRRAFTDGRKWDERPIPEHVPRALGNDAIP